VAFCCHCTHFSMPKLTIKHNLATCVSLTQQVGSKRQDKQLLRGPFCFLLVCILFSTSLFHRAAGVRIPPNEAALSQSKAMPRPNPRLQLVQEQDCAKAGCSFLHKPRERDSISASLFLILIDSPLPILNLN